jgi:hypothetical protein
MTETKSKGKNKQKVQKMKAIQGKAVSQGPSKQYVPMPAKAEARMSGMSAGTQLALRNMLINEDGTPARWPTDINCPTATMQNKDVIDVVPGPEVTDRVISTAAAGKGQFMVHNHPYLRSGIVYTASTSVTMDTSAGGGTPFNFVGTGPASILPGQLYWVNFPLQTNVGARLLYPNGMIKSPAAAGFPEAGATTPGYFLSRTVAQNPSNASKFDLEFFPKLPGSANVTIYYCRYDPNTAQWIQKSLTNAADALYAGMSIDGSGAFSGILETVSAFAIQLNVGWSGQLTMTMRTVDGSGSNTQPGGTIFLPQCTYNCSTANRQNYERLEADGVHYYRCTALTVRVTNLTPELQKGGVGDSYLMNPVNRMGYYPTLSQYIGGRYPYARVGFEAKNGDYKYWLPFDARSGIFRGIAQAVNQDRSIIQVFTLPDKVQQSFRVTTVMDIEFISDAPGYSYALASPDPDFWSGVMLLAALDNCNENPSHVETLKKAFKKVMGVVSSPKTWERLGKAATVAAGLLAV